MPVHRRCRSLLLLLACLVTGACVLPSNAAARATLGDWDAAQQRQVVRAGLMGGVSRHNFGGAQRLTAGQANRSMAALAKLIDGRAATYVSTPVPVSDASQSVLTVVGFDALVDDQLGLADVAAHVQRATAAVGLRPPPYYGTEVVARFLGLRYDHPAGTDQLELFPTGQITRAEAAWSLAQVLDNGSWSISSARESLSAYRLPHVTGGQLAALRIAVSRIGYPYVYAGTTDNTADGLAHGGFDCSGFVWRVYKVSGLQWGRKIHGRTAAQMAGEIPRRQRLHYSQLQPGDILFFGSAHFNSVATEANVMHAGIYLGDNWVIHSSGQGVYVLPLKGSWLGDQFVWGRHVLP
jgi:cell wall-associated NlpC family hydrolase